MKARSESTPTKRKIDPMSATAAAYRSEMIPKAFPAKSTYEITESRGQSHILAQQSRRHQQEARWQNLLRCVDQHTVLRQLPIVQEESSRRTTSTALRQF